MTIHWNKDGQGATTSARQDGTGVAVRDAFPPREPLNALGREFYERLPAPNRPARTLARFPHVINQIALAWGRPRAFDQLMDDLLLCTTASREGFPFEIVVELSDLREFHDARLPGGRPFS